MPLPIIRTQICWIFGMNLSDYGEWTKTFHFAEELGSYIPTWHRGFLDPKTIANITIHAAFYYRNGLVIKKINNTYDVGIF